MMRFWQLRVGDFFHVHGDTFLKLPLVLEVDLPDANAVNASTGRLACFGPTVRVEYMLASQFDPHNGRAHTAPPGAERNAAGTKKLH